MGYEGRAEVADQGDDELPLIAERRGSRPRWTPPRKGQQPPSSDGQEASLGFYLRFGFLPVYASFVDVGDQAAAASAANTVLADEWIFGWVCVGVSYVLSVLIASIAAYWAGALLARYWQKILDGLRQSEGIGAAMPCTCVVTPTLRGFGSIVVVSLAFALLAEFEAVHELMLSLALAAAGCLVGHLLSEYVDHLDLDLGVGFVVNLVSVALAVLSRARFAPHILGEQVATKLAPVFCGAMSQFTPTVGAIADGYMRDDTRARSLRQLLVHTGVATVALLCASGGLGEPLVTQTERRRMVLYSWSWDGLARDIVRWGSSS